MSIQLRIFTDPSSLIPDTTLEVSHTEAEMLDLLNAGRFTKTLNLSGRSLSPRRSHLSAGGGLVEVYRVILPSGVSWNADLPGDGVDRITPEASKYSFSY